MRSVQIEKDLAFLRFDKTTIESAGDAEALLPVIDSPEAALGSAWVVEGSSLGGALLGRKLEAVLGSAGPEHGGAFFGPAKDGLDRWNACCAAVELCGTDTPQYTALETASIATFDAFEAWLKPGAWSQSHGDQ